MNFYKQLRKIKRPVFIITIRKGWLLRARILKPNGDCEWNSHLWKTNDIFDCSCFRKTGFNLKQTVTAMENYDKKCKIKILGVIGL